MTSLYSTGVNISGQLGLGDNTSRNEFARVGAINTWETVACGGQHTAAVRADGTLWTTGHNNFGQLGLGDKSARDEFAQVGSGTTWSLVGCSFYSTLAIKTDGTLWATGLNDVGQLGIGDNTDRDEFAQVGSGNTWSLIAGGVEHQVAIKTDGTLWATGSNGNGQLGLGDKTNRNAFTRVGTGTIWETIAGGSSHTVAAKTDGTLWATGLNDFGQLGLGDNTDRDEFARVGSGSTWEAIAAGYHHSIATKTDGTLWTTGSNLSGELGLGDSGFGMERNTFTQVGALTTWGSITGGYQTSYAVRTDGTAWATGYNANGELGLGDSSERDEFTQTGESASWSAVWSMFAFAFLDTVAPRLGRHRGIVGINGGVLFNEKTIIGDSTGNLYALNMDTYTDAGNAITRVRRTQIISDGDINLLHNRVEVEFEAGVGLDGGDDPEATLKWSDDGGDTFSDGEATSIGEYDDWGARAIWRSLGKSRDRVYELTISAPVKVVMIGAYSILKKCRF